MSNTPPTSDGPRLLPASSVAESMWLAERMEPDSVLYNVPMAWRIRGRLDATALRTAFERVVERHEILRTAFVAHDGRLRMVAGAPWVPELERMDLRDVPADKREQRLGDVLRTEAERRFDLTSGRPLRACLIDLDGGDGPGDIGDPSPTQVLFVCVHHLVWDAASTAPFLEDLRRHYDEAALRPSPWPQAPSGRTGGDNPGSCVAPVELDDCRQLTAFAAQQGVDLDAVLLAAVRLLVSWYSGRWEVMVDPVGPGRAGAGPGSADRVGLLLGSTPAQSFRSLVADSADRLATAARPGDAARAEDTGGTPSAPGGRHEAADRGPGARDTAPVTVLFGYSPGPVARSAAEGPPGGYDLEVSLSRQGSGVRGRLRLNGPRVEADAARRFAAHLTTVLDQAVRDPDTPIGRFEPLSEHERWTQLVAWNDTAATGPDTTVHDLVRARAEAQPDAVALTSGTRRYTYRELVARAEAVARGLVAGGVRVGDVVALAIDRGAEQIEAMLGVLIAGAAYVPVDPALPAERLAFVLRDCATRWLVTGGRTAPPDPVAAGDDVHVVTLDALAARGADHVGLPVVPPDATAYCIYTSGTTGRPKGVVVSHRNVVRLLDNDRFPFAFGPDDVWTMFHSYAFDVSVWEVFCCLAHGGRLVTVDRDVARDATRFWALVARERVTVVCHTPSALAQLAERDLLTIGAGHLRYLILAGEKLLPKAVTPLLTGRPELRVANMYGPTEATVYATLHFLTAQDVADNASVIGRPVPTTTVYLLDPLTGDRLLPPGAIGEIHLGGGGVAAGYLRRPELDAARFVPDPFGPGRLYRTGDFGRYRPDGSVEYLGRRDSQVKLRGHRIELEEIASCLRAHPAVDDAVVVLDADDERRLAAYVRFRTPLDDPDELRRHLRDLLPEYMIPARWFRMGARPLTGNGKLDLARLRELAEPIGSAPRQRPATATARAIAEVWSRVLGIPEPDAEASLFELGGHSLMVMQLVGHLSRRLGVTLSVRDVFEHSRLDDLADHIDRLRADRPAPAAQAPDAAPGADSPGPRPAQPARQYREFVRDQLEWRHSARYEAGLRHWVSHLAGAPSSLAVEPPHRPEPHGAVAVPLPTDALNRLNGLGTALGVTWFMVAAAALAATLHRWAGQDDIAFGSPVSLRGERYTEVVGPCLNTVVLRSTCDGTTSVGELLRAMRTTVLDALEHARVPFETVVEKLKPPRRPGWTPYLDVALVGDVRPPEPPTLGGAQLSVVPFDGVDLIAKFGMTAAFVEDAGRLHATMYFRGDRFTRGEVERMARWLGRLLDRFTEVLDEPLRTLDLVDGAERAELARFESGGPTVRFGEPGGRPDGPATRVGEPARTVPEQVARWYRNRPDATAVVSTRGELTYAALEERVRGLADRLAPWVRGTPPVVVVSLPRGEDLVVAMLAAWRAGCAFCPLEPEYPLSRVDFILDDLDACAVLTVDGELAAHLAGGPVPVIDPAGTPAGPAATDRDVAWPDPDATAYVLYTSGTTGEPKGVAYSHGSLADVTAWHIAQFGFGPRDRVSQIHSVAFDVTQWELWPALCAGATVLPYERRVLAPELARWLADQAVTAFFAPTPLAEILWSVRADLPRLRWMFFAGSALTQRPPQERPYQICNGYGPTETFITTTDVVAPGAAGPLNRIGRPVGGNRVYVLDEAGRRCPVGVPGEIHVAGASVSQGYWRRPELTGRRFAGTDPDGAPSRVYRTGDRGRWLPDGTLEYLGRVDRQLKVRGYRVEPQEIEAHLRADPLVERAVVHAFSSSGPLVGYVVARDGAARDTAATLARLRIRLPSFMLPDTIVWLDQLPMTSRGKVDTAALPRPGRDALVSGAPRTEPASDLERRIAEMWRSVLGVEVVGAQDNFFDLGGNSLLLATLHARLQDALGRTLPIRMLFEYPTVATLATGLTSADDGPSTDGHDDARARAERARRARSARTPRRWAAP